MSRKSVAVKAAAPLAGKIDEDSKLRIVRAATKLFSLHGYDGTTTKAICDEAQVNIAAVHYHFETKELLFKFIIASFGGHRLQSAQRVLIPCSSGEELRVRLLLFYEESLDTYLRQPEVWRIIQTEMELMHSRSEEVFKATFFLLFDTLVAFLSHAKSKGLIGKQIDPKIAAQFLFGQLKQATRCRAVSSKYLGMSIEQESFRKQWLQQSIDIFLSGVKA